MKRAPSVNKASPSTKEKRTMSQAFDKWMDDYTNNPSAFEAMESSAIEHLKAKLKGERSSYGLRCEAVLLAYMGK